MKLYRHLKPTLLGASALLLSACAGGTYNAPAVVAPTQQTPASGQAELRQIADRLAQSGDHEAAIPLYRHLGSSTGDPSALAALANSLIAQGAHDDATSVLLTVIERGQANGDVWYSLGKARLATGRFQEALASFDIASSTIGHQPKVRSGRAIALAALGQVGEAFVAFNGGTDRLSQSNMALILAATGQPDAAVRMLEPVISRNIGTSRDRQNLAMAYLLAGQEQEAYRIARLDLDPATINETFTFYRSLASLTPQHRMQALVTGAVDPEWTRTEVANFELQETNDRRDAAQRLVEENILARAPKPTILAEAPKPEPKPKSTAESRKDYVLTEIPPLVEPEGWALQIGAYRTIKNLMRGWTILYRQSGDLLEDIPPRRSEVDFGDKDDEPSGFYYRLNAGPLKSFARAKELCRALTERGTSCWIRPPEKAEGKLPEAHNVKKTEPEKGVTADASELSGDTLAIGR